MSIVIKKRVDFGFLGEDYREAYLEFQSIPISDYTKILEELPQPNQEYLNLVQEASTGELSEDKKGRLKELQLEESDNNKKNLELIVTYLKKYFLAGKFPDEKGLLQDITEKDDLDGLDSNSAVKCFGVLTGQDSDPKGETPSSTPSTTAESLQ